MLLLAFGVAATWQLSEQRNATDDVLEHSRQLSADAASIHRSLARANTMASAEFLVEKGAADEERKQYKQDIRTAAELLTRASANPRASESAREQITKLNRGLPRYTGLVETARANRRTELPAGDALQYAHDQMTSKLLPIAQNLHETESARLKEHYDEMRERPIIHLALGLATLVALIYGQWLLYRRTNRVFNPGLLIATAAVLGILVWAGGTHSASQSRLETSGRHGTQALQQVSRTWTSVFQARGSENMWLLRTGEDSKEHEETYRGRMDDVTGYGLAEGQLDAARALADDWQGRQAVEEARKAVRLWEERHQLVRHQKILGNDAKALDLMVKPDGSTGSAFNMTDSALWEAFEHEQRDFRAATSGHTALAALPAGAAVLALLAALAVLLGVGRRIAEYR